EERAAAVVCGAALVGEEAAARRELREERLGAVAHEHIAAAAGLHTPLTLRGGSRRAVVLLLHLDGAVSRVELEDEPPREGPLLGRTRLVVEQADPVPG